MKLLLGAFLLICFAVACVWLSLHLQQWVEGFQEATATAIATEKGSEEFQKTYDAWRQWSTAFQGVWQKALTTAVGLERPLPAEGSTATPPPVTLADMNTYRQLLSQKLGQALPVVTDPFPAAADLTALQTHFSAPTGTKEAYLHAVEWVNQQMEASFAEMGHALAGKGAVEGFYDGVVEGFDSQCADLVTCLEQHPDQEDRLMAALEARRAAKAMGKKEDLTVKMNAILKDPELAAAMAKNKTLAAKAQEVQKQATSGELLQQLNLPTDPNDAAVSTYSLPDGANRLKDMDPAKRAQYEKSFGSLVSLKQTLDQINSRL